MLPKEWVEELVYGKRANHRFTQDTPILPDVWFEYAQNGGRRTSLLLTPHYETSPGFLAAQLDVGNPAQMVAHNQTVVVADLTYLEMLRQALPLSVWWKNEVGPLVDGTTVSDRLRQLARLDPPRLAELLDGSDKVREELGLPRGLVLMLRVGGILARALEKPPSSSYEWLELRHSPEVVHCLADLYAGLKVEAPGTLWLVQRNRPAQACSSASCQTIKADAARSLFSISCSKINWAIVDSGVDARHPAFRRRDAKGELAPLGDAWQGQSRVVRTYDFTRLRALVQGAAGALEGARRLHTFTSRLIEGADVDWKGLSAGLEIPHDQHYLPPTSPHGTHVAGILGADLRDEDAVAIGVCPDVELFDLRVLNGEGQGDEFSVMAALQFVRYLNSKSERMVVHGVNLSLSLFHNVRNYACGRTPICEECERLVGSGVATVAAAGNQGYQGFETKNGLLEGYQDISITDPGNADGVITVGSTHYGRPHTYGVSYFSSRGPTGDGRCKPDLVAPGEKIQAPIPGGGLDSMDGTSMAAPHVSGACALLMARHGEFVGQPQRIKKVLCQSATDLGRDRYFQGAGMLDVLRALQCV
ncbi:MAG: S8 family peptidase [Vulcanimicrobiota bacterium]